MSLQRECYSAFQSNIARYPLRWPEICLNNYHISDSTFIILVGSLYLEELSGVAVLTQGVEDLDLDGMYLDSDEEEGN